MLCSHVGRFHDPGICQLYFVSPSNKLEMFVHIHIFRLNLGIWVELYSHDLCTRIIVHPNIIPYYIY